MKELKDYIHLYIGCKVMAKDPRLEEDHAPVLGVLTGLHGEYGPEVAFFDTPHHTSESPEYPGEVKLVLRPLKSLTEEEAKQYARLKGYKDDYIQNFKFIHAGFEFGNENSMTFLCLVPPYGNQHKPEQFTYLLSKWFDVFGLHAAGLCVYENEVKG